MVIQAELDLLIVGQGADGRMRVADDARQALERAGIAFVASPTPQAVQRCNAASPDKVIAAAFHLTC
ncbi:MAG: MTH938/NDUFAF3 family protein [Anaerolineae bacterium]